jgi:hypothetical protein
MKLTKILKVNHDPEYPSLHLDNDVANFLDKCGKTVKVTFELSDNLDVIKKLEALYAVKKTLHPITMVIISGLHDVRKNNLKEHDVEYIETIYDNIFPRITESK